MKLRRIQRQLLAMKRSAFVVPVCILLAIPTSTNYQLESFEFDGGGGTGASSNYSMEADAGEVAGDSTGPNYRTFAGLIFTQQANVPTVSLANNGSWYNKLLVMIGTENNPSDAKYAIAISTDDFTTTQWVQNDNTVGQTLGVEDFQTYAEWGSGSGEYIIGLEGATAYKVKAKASHGEYSESPLGPEATASTSNVSLSFDIDIGGSSDPGETGAPYQVAVGEMTVGTVTTATNRVWVDVATNAEAGGYVYIYDQYGGLRSTNVNYTIASATTDLGSASEGFGLQAETAGQSSGGPLAKVAPYNGSGNTVGIVNTTIRELFSTSSSPISDGRGSFLIKSKAGSTTPAAGDYTDTLTLISAATF